ncbi:MAG: ABC-2 family transporter protein [Synechococcaceae cyanobacterium]|nr:ABC-2 family transporter protein [Synechococcaceae cyanobacterium]
MPPIPRRLRRLCRLARVLLTTQYAYMLEYRAEIALWALSGVLPLIMLGLWQGSGRGLSGLSPTQLTRYFLAAFVVRQFTIVWVIHSFEEDHIEGRLSPYLLQPLPPVWRYVSAHLAEQATRLPFVVALAGAFLLVQPQAFALPSPTALLLGVIATHLAFALRFLLQFALTMLCFWSERAAALERLLFIPYLYLSGLVAPLEAYPEGVKAVARWTPFPYVLHMPAQLLAGGPVNATAGFAVMAAWAALLLPLTLLLWRAGLRRYGAMGA